MVTDRIVILIAALILNGLLGGPRRWHRRLGFCLPGQWITRLVKALERRLNRNKRSAADLSRRGMVLTIAVCLAALAIGGAVRYALGAGWLIEWGWLTEIVLVASQLSLRQDADLANMLAQQLEKGETEAARDTLRSTAWRNAALLDEHGISRAAVETIAVHFSDRILTPGCCYLLLGLPGIFACRALLLLADTTGHGRDAFGRIPAQVNALLQYIPSLLGDLLALASSLFLPFCSPAAAARQWLYHTTEVDYRRRQAALFGAALNVALGGPASVYAQGPWVGGAVAKLYPRDARRGALLLWFSSFLLLLSLLLALFVA